jgi:hypothetical protein
MMDRVSTIITSDLTIPVELKPSHLNYACLKYVDQHICSAINNNTTKPDQYIQYLKKEKIYSTNEHPVYITNLVLQEYQQ